MPVCHTVTGRNVVNNLQKLVRKAQTKVIWNLVQHEATIHTYYRIYKTYKKTDII